MKKFAKNHLFTVILIAVLLVGMLPATLAADFYGDYSDVAKIKDYGSCPSMQGMAMGSQMVYTIKINSDDTLANIYMTDKDTGTTNRMTDSSDGSYYFSGMGHANDMAVWGFDGLSHLFVTTMKEGSGAIVRLRRNGTKLTRVGSYSLSYNGSPIAASGIDIIGVSGGKIQLITKLGQTIYTGSLDSNATKGDIAMTKLCVLAKDKVVIKGSTMDLSDWVNQGFGYYDNTLFVPYTGPDGSLHRSVVCVYNLDNVVPGSTLYPTESVTFRVTSGAYSALFEIESADVCSTDKMLYFNTNRRKTTSDTNHDGVSTFDGYTYSKLSYNIDETKHFTARFLPNGGSGSMADQTVYNGVSVPLSKNAFTRTGYTFAGWTAHRLNKDQWYYTNGTDSGWYKKGAQPSGWSLYVYKDGQKVSNTSSVHKDTVEFNAQWEKNTTYTVTWNVDGVKTTETYAEGQTPSFKGSTAKASNGCTSYTFTGWDKAITAVTGDVTYTAQYSESTNHNWITVPGKAATCTQNGLTDGIKCSACGTVKTAQQTIPAKGHSYSTAVTAPTCTDGGYTTYTCSCGDSYVADEVPAKGHSFVDGSCFCGAEDPAYIDPNLPYSLVGDMNGWDESASVMTGDGIVSVTMELKQGTYRFKIRRGYLEYGNDGIIANTTASTSESGWVMTTTAGSCTLNASGGVYRFSFNPDTCQLVVIRVGNETEDAPVTNGTITLSAMTLSLEDEIVYNLYFEIQDIAADTDQMGLILWDEMPALPFINGGGTVMEGAVYLPETDRYCVSSMGIPAKNMGDVKYMVVYAKQTDGTYVYSRVLQYSAKTYCLNRVQLSSDDRMRALCVALMNYGAEAQKYFASISDYTYTELMNEGFEAYQYLVQPYSSDLLKQPTAVSASKAGSFGTTATGFSSRSASMSADGTFALNYYFTTSRSVETVTFYYWTAEQYAAVTELTADNASGVKEMVPTQTANQFWANYDGIAARDMDQTVYVCGVYQVDGETYSTGVLAYSMAKYCISKAETACDIQDFAKAMTVYGYQAKSYFCA